MRLIRRQVGRRLVRGERRTCGFAAAVRQLVLGGLAAAAAAAPVAPAAADAPAALVAVSAQATLVAVSAQATLVAVNATAAVAAPAPAANSVSPATPSTAGTQHTAPADAMSDVAAKAAGERWWAHVRYLADDKLKGRLTGTAEYRKAAQYVADRFKEYGLEPAGTDGYFQPVAYESQRVVALDSHVQLVRTAGDGSAGRGGGGVDRLTLGEDVILGTRLPQPRSIEASLVFAGYGLHLPDAGFDDLAAVDCKGKVVVYIYGGPAAVPGNLKAHGRASQEFTRALQDAGAVGAIGIFTPTDVTWGRMALAASQVGMRLADAGQQDSRGPFFSATFNVQHGDKLLAGSGHTMQELMDLVAHGKALPRMNLPMVVRAKVETVSDHVEAPNVAGLLRGSDAALAPQVVVLSAHLDHLGVGEPIRGDRIYNGAMDNASGVASLLEIARQAAAGGAGGHRPRRSLLFVVVGGEEKGLLGSRYFATHPTVPSGDMVADLNVDMFLPLVPLKMLSVEGIEESSLGDDVRAVGAAVGVEVIPDRFPDSFGFIRSDQYSFIRVGVPAIEASFAAPPDSADDKTLNQWVNHHYHAPSDDTSQPVDLAAAGRYDQLMLDLALRVADADQRPEWKKDSFFRRFAAAGGR